MQISLAPINISVCSVDRIQLISSRSAYLKLHRKKFGAEDGFQQEISDCVFCGNVSDWKCFKPIEWVYHLLNTFIPLERMKCSHAYALTDQIDAETVILFLQIICCRITKKQNENFHFQNSCVEYGFSKVVLKCFHLWWCCEMQTMRNVVDTSCETDFAIVQQIRKF